jgi:hypothetical protein
MEEASEEAQQAYTDAQSRARDVEMLVRSLNEVAALFQDLAVLVQHQSEMLDSIEENVETAGEQQAGGRAAPGGGGGSLTVHARGGLLSNVPSSAPSSAPLRRQVRPQGQRVAALRDRVSEEGAQVHVLCAHHRHHHHPRAHRRPGPLLPGRDQDVMSGRGQQCGGAAGSVGRGRTG